MIDVLLQRFAGAGEKTALVSAAGAFTYADLMRAIAAWEGRLRQAGVAPGAVVLLKGDFSLAGIAALLALLKCRMLTIPLAPTSYEKQAEFASEGRAQWIVEADGGTVARLPHDGAHAHYDALRQSASAGIILFSSGSTGVSKGVVHDASRLLEKFRKPGKDLRTLAFLLFDHIAGLDTLFYSLAGTSTLVLPSSRSPGEVCRLIAEHGIEVLPTAPSFLNLLILSGAHEAHDLSSLKIITYGSEMMPRATLETCAALFPHVRLIQKYGTSETGALPTQSKDNASTWVKLGGAGYDWRVRDGLFEIRAATAMVGYLNAPSPFTQDGYFMTGDRVEVDGEHVRFLGRDSDIINVGGQKVFPAEVENAIKDMAEIAEVAVYGVPHAILGQAVVARIRPRDPEASPPVLRSAVRQHLAGRLETYKIPQKYEIVHEPLTTDRFKTRRRAGA